MIRASCMKSERWTEQMGTHNFVQNSQDLWAEHVKTHPLLPGTHWLHSQAWDPQVWDFMLPSSTHNTLIHRAGAEGRTDLMPLFPISSSTNLRTSVFYLLRTRLKPLSIYPDVCQHRTGEWLLLCSAHPLVFPPRATSSGLVVKYWMDCPRHNRFKAELVVKFT